MRGNGLCVEIEFASRIIILDVVDGLVIATLYVYVCILHGGLAEW